MFLHASKWSDDGGDGGGAWSFDADSWSYSSSLLLSSPSTGGVRARASERDDTRTTVTANPHGPPKAWESVAAAVVHADVRSYRCAVPLASFTARSSSSSSSYRYNNIVGVDDFYFCFVFGYATKIFFFGFFFSVQYLFTLIIHFIIFLCFQA